MTPPSSPVAKGVALAAASALMFGATIPFVGRASQGLGPLTVGALLYSGAALASLALRPFSRRSGRRLGWGEARRLVAVAAFGAALAPVLLVWGLARTGATSASLALNLEAMFTVALARALYREPIGRRVAGAAVAMLVGGGLIALDAAGGTDLRLPGIIAVVGATACWATDNTLSRGLAEIDPLEVVAAKGLLGALVTGTLAVVLAEPIPSAVRILVLLACGASGYGLSLRLYLMAQRRMGAARTGSVFAAGPFAGAALAWALGDRSAGPLTLLGTGAFGIGVWLHATERHAHAHVHEALEHEHAHRHDDGHHAHVHDPPFEGEHTHPHRHELVEHEHEHAPDLHHDHDHRLGHE